MDEGTEIELWKLEPHGWSLWVPNFIELVTLIFDR